MNGCNFSIAILYNEDGQVARGDPDDLLAVQYTITATQNLYEALTSQGYRVVKIAVRDSLEELEDSLCSFSPNETFIFSNCDGFNGDNQGAARVIRLVEKMGFKHTGALADSIDVCIDKPRCKESLKQAGVPTPLYQVFADDGGDFNLEFPVIVKPSVEDASMGIDLGSVVCNKEDLHKRVRYILEKYQQPALVEQYIAGRELAVAMMGNRAVEILPIAEDDFSAIPDPLQHVLTYESKWKTESVAYSNIPSRVPALLSRREEQAVRKVAEGSFRAVGLRDLGRVDIRFQNGIPYVIDINEIPDLSPDAGFWNSARVTGITYPQMVERILTHAMEREGWIS
ncbi:MAG TPA: ATP-grasp domain-containing protein [Anaerolineales bacterium]|nr:ATP-grasp domain-containing protein [Anaerolineales bacterium]